MRVVFDTNVLLSGSVWRAAPFRCLEAARQHSVTGFTCQQILEELTDKLTNKLKLPDEQVTQTLIELLDFLIIVEVKGTLRGVCADPDDDMILECAVIAQATHLVTGDKRHLLPLKSFQGTQIISPADFLVSMFQS